MLYSQLVAEKNHLHPITWRLLAGLEAGIAAAIVMAVYVFAANLLFERYAWDTPRLFAAVFFDATGFRWSPGMALLIGYSLLFLVSGIQGLLFGLIVRPRVGRVWSANLGVLFSLGWYLVVLRVIVAALDPGALFRFSQATLLVGYFIFGAVFASYPGLHYHISRPVAAVPLPAATAGPAAPADPVS